MRITQTLDTHVAEKLRAEAALGNLSFKEHVNQALKQALGIEKSEPVTPFEVMTFSSAFQPGIDPQKLQQFLDDEEAEIHSR
jgi:hypothetical protein